MEGLSHLLRAVPWGCREGGERAIEREEREKWGIQGWKDYILSRFLWHTCPPPLPHRICGARTAPREQPPLTDVTKRIYKAIRAELDPERQRWKSQSLRLSGNESPRSRQAFENIHRERNTALCNLGEKLIRGKAVQLLVLKK